jgi:hypothetical protein
MPQQSPIKNKPLIGVFFVAEKHPGTQEKARKINQQNQIQPRRNSTQNNNKNVLFFFQTKFE